MNHYRLYKNLNVQPFLEEINLNDDWAQATQKFYGKDHYLTQHGLCPTNYLIELIKAFRNPGDPITEPLGKLCVDINHPILGSTFTGAAAEPIFKKYKVASAFLGWFKETHNAQIARVRYVKMPSKSSIGLHIDGGPYYQKHNRFHFVLQGEYQYTVNGEMQEYKEGELWWFDNIKLHKSYIHGSKDRIAMIFDCKCDMERIINHEPL